MGVYLARSLRSGAGGIYLPSIVTLLVASKQERAQVKIGGGGVYVCVDWVDQ